MCGRLNCLNLATDVEVLDCVVEIKYSRMGGIVIPKYFNGL
jgi:hypothetical protein